MITDHYQGKVVALTGAASGIGHELVRQLAGKGARFSLADIRHTELHAFSDELKVQGVDVITSHVDVRNPAEVQAFADRTFETYGRIDYVFSNAGVSAVGNTWRMPIVDWHWLVDVNLMGAIHAARAFVPGLIAQDRPCHFVVTASAAGFVTGWGGAGYAATKHALIGVVESLELDLQKAGAQVKSHVICPGYVLSNLHNSFDYRSEVEWNPDDPAYQDSDYVDAMERSIRSTSVTGMPTDEAVTTILTELDDDKFVIFTHPQYIPVIKTRYANLLAGERPGLAD